MQAFVAKNQNAMAYIAAWRFKINPRFGTFVDLRILFERAVKVLPLLIQPINPTKIRVFNIWFFY